jgi:hypothetical protein
MSVKGRSIAQEKTDVVIVNFDNGVAGESLLKRLLTSHYINQHQDVSGVFIRIAVGRVANSRCVIVTYHRMFLFFRYPRLVTGSRWHATRYGDYASALGVPSLRN